MFKILLLSLPVFVVCVVAGYAAVVLVRGLRYAFSERGRLERKLYRNLKSQERLLEDFPDADTIEELTDRSLCQAVLDNLKRDEEMLRSQLRHLELKRLE